MMQDKWSRLRCTVIALAALVAGCNGYSSSVPQCMYEIRPGESVDISHVFRVHKKITRNGAVAVLDFGAGSGTLVVQSKRGGEAEYESVLSRLEECRVSTGSTSKDSR